jgi:hypothetical protein
MNRIILFIFIITTFTAASVAADPYYVNSRKAPIWAAPTFTAVQTGALTKGDLVIGLENRGGWRRVRYNNQPGWMLKLMLSSQPPIDSETVRQQTIETMSQRARRRPSSFASTAAARGFKDKRRRFSEKLRLNYKALEHMESFRVDDQQALEFLKGAPKND